MANNYKKFVECYTLHYMYKGSHFLAKKRVVQYKLCSNMLKSLVYLTIYVCIHDILFIYLHNGMNSINSSSINLI